MTIEVVAATPDHRGDVMNLVASLCEENGRRVSLKQRTKLEVNPSTVGMFFEAATAFPDSKVYFPLLYLEGVLAGFAVLHEQVRSTLVGNAITEEKFSFLWALYKSPIISVQGKRVRTMGVGNSELRECMVSWGKSRGHHHLMGNCLPGFKLKAAEVWGFKPLQITIGMEL